MSGAGSTIAAVFGAGSSSGHVGESCALPLSGSIKYVIYQIQRGTVGAWTDEFNY